MPDGFRRFRNWPRRWRPDECREDVESADGTITFNWLQQRPVDDTADIPLEPPTTDPWDVTDGAVENV